MITRRRNESEASFFARCARADARRAVGDGWRMIGADIRKALVMERAAFIAYGWVGGSIDLFKEIVGEVLRQHDAEEGNER